MSVGPPPSYQSVVGGGGSGYPGPPVHTSPSAPSMPPSTVTGMRPYANPYQPAVPPAAYNVQNPTNKGSVSVYLSVCLAFILYRLRLYGRF